MNDILCKTKFSTIFFGSLIDGHFENVLTRSREVIRHTCVRQWKASRPESNNFDLFHSDIGHHLETEIRSEE